MTCIVGMTHKGKVYIGGDSAGTGGYDQTLRVDKKVFTNGKYIMGFTTSYRMGQLLMCKLDPPKWRKEEELYTFMVNDFIDSVRRCLKLGGWAYKKEEVERGGTFLVGYKERLFKIDSDYQVGESILPYDACGCGESYALGSLYSSRLKDPRGKITQALKCAEHFSAGVGGPFHIVSI